MSESRNKALLIEVIGENAVIEGVDFDFEAPTYSNIFGGKTITVTDAERLAEANQKYSSCAVMYCTDEGIEKKADENIIAAILMCKGEKLPPVYGKALVLSKTAGAQSGFTLFTDSEITELIDLCDDIVRAYAESSGQ